MKACPTGIRSLMVLPMILLFLNITESLAQTSNPLEWYTFYGAHETEIHHGDRGQSIAYFNQSLFVSGFLNGPGNFNPVQTNRAYTPYYGDGFVASLTPDGENVDWITFFGGGTGDESCTDIVVNSQGIFVCGYSGVWSGQLPAQIRHPHYSGGGKDAFVAKLSHGGNFEWLTFLGGSQEDVATSITVDEARGAIYVTGKSRLPWIQDAFQRDPVNPHSYMINQAWQDDAFVVKLDMDGFCQWHTFMGGLNGNGMGDGGTGIGVDAAGNVFVCGNSAGSWGVPLPGFSHYGGGTDGFVARLDPMGNHMWHMFIGNMEMPAFEDLCKDLQVDDAGNIFVTGSTWGDWNQALWGTPRVEYGFNEDRDLFVCKIDATGRPQWHTILGAGGGNSGNGIVLTENGDIGVAGVDNAAWGNLAFPKYPDGGIDQLVAKLDNEGNLLWNAMMGGYYYDEALAIAANEEGHLITAGFSQCPWQCAGEPLHPHVGFSHNGYHTELSLASLNTDVSAIVPEYNTVRVVQGETASLRVQVFDPCRRFADIFADMGNLSDNGDGTWTWSLETSTMAPGHYDIRLFASESLGSNPEAGFKLIVNSDPVMQLAKEIVSAEVGETATNIITTEDFDGDPVAVELRFSPGSLSQNPDGTWTWTFPTTGMEPGMYHVALLASDGFGGFSEVSFPVRVTRAPTAQEIESRIGTGIDWLASAQRDDGSWNGPYHVIHIDAPVTCTGLALTKLGDYAREQGHSSPLDDGYIYDDRVERGLDYLLSQARSWGSSGGIFIHADAPPYYEAVSTAAAMMGIASCTLPHMTVDYPANPVVHGKSYLEVMSLMVDYLALSQDGMGSWGGNTPDAGKVVYGLMYAEAFGCTIPQIMKDKLMVWINFIQRDDGSAGYGDPGDDWPENMLMTNTANLMVLMAFADLPPEDARVRKALDFISYLWSHPDEDRQWLEQNMEVLFAMMRAFMSYSVETIEVDGESINWYKDFSTELIFIKPQGEEGFWIFSWGADRLLNTEWALMILEKTYPEVVADLIPPTIDCPEDLILTCDVSTNPPATGEATATDNMDPEVSVDYADEIIPGQCPQSYTILRTWTATDASGNTSECMQTIAVADDMAPLISGLPAGIVRDSDPGACGAAVFYPGIAATDFCQEEALLMVDPPSGSFFPVGHSDVLLRAEDACGNSSTATFTVTVANDQPLLMDLQAPTDPVTVNSMVNVSARYIDNNPDQAVWDWGDGSTSNAVIREEITGSHEYQEAGMYRLSLTLTDQCGESDTDTYEYIVVYDVSGGFVTGGGWFNSPAGACTLHPHATGKANFGFVSKYKKGATVPTGNTEFQFKAGDLNFHGKAYDWLVIEGSKAMFEGEGTINGSGQYGFMISAIDGNLISKGRKDKLRMRIWHQANEEAVIYDNQVGCAADEDPLKAIGGGSIVIHTGAKFKSTGDPPGAGNEALTADIDIHPNPFSGSAFIYLKHEADTDLTIKVYNMAGKLMQDLYSGSIREGRDYSFELKAGPGMDPGSYLILFTIGEEVITRRVILQK